MSTCQFFSQFFKRLNEDKITCCILRNYENLPEKVKNDVDIWVDKIYWERFSQIVKDVAYTLNYTLNYTPRLTVKGEGDYFLSKFINNQLNVIHLDCWAYLHWRGICFVNESVIGNNLIWNEKGFYIPASGIEAAINLLKELLYHKKVDDKYKEKARNLMKDDPLNFLKAIERPFGSKKAKFIFERAKDGNWEALEKHANKLRFILFLRSFQSPITQLTKWFYYVRGQIRRFFIRPHGLFIILIGPDGSGKSTTINNLIESDIRRLFQKKLYFHGHFPFLPELKSIVAFFNKRKNINTILPVDNPSANSKPHGMLRAMVYPIYYGFNYILGHFFIWKEKARGNLIIFDRYFYDYLIQNQYANCPRWLLYTIARVIPKPDMVVYLKNQPEVIFSRKPELPIEDIKRQSEICEGFIKRFKNGYVVDTNSEDEVVERIQRIVLSKIKEKQGK